MKLASRLRVSLVRSEIARAKALALRRGVWFRVLTRVERACLDLSVMVVQRVRSRLLAGVLRSILCKLCNAMESRVVRLAREIGRPLARSVSAVAQRWGNESAFEWAEDKRFIRFLVICQINAG